MYDRIMAKALRTPWLITEEYRDIIYGILRFRSVRGRLTADELRERIAVPRRPERPTDASIAVIPIWGVIANRTFDASSGMTSIESIRPVFRRAMNDDDVSAILFDINSPGGTVPGVPEFAAEILAARAVKPVVAFCDDLMCSAAYYLGSQATEIVSIPTGDIGSIGVYLLHVSERAWLEKEGLKVTAITYGENKVKGAPWDDLDDDTKAFLQQDVDRIGREFDGAVARGRGVSLSDVRDTFGQGRCYNARKAKSLGLIDRIGSFEETLVRLIKGSRRRASAQAEDVSAGLAEWPRLANAGVSTPEADSPDVPDTRLAEDQIARDHQALSHALGEGQW